MSANAFHILSLSSGGYPGLFTAMVLAELKRRLGRPVASAFDLIAQSPILVTSHTDRALLTGLVVSDTFVHNRRTASVLDYGPVLV